MKPVPLQSYRSMQKDIETKLESARQSMNKAVSINAYQWCVDVRGLMQDLRARWNTLQELIDKERT